MAAPSFQDPLSAYEAGSEAGDATASKAGSSSSTTSPDATRSTLRASSNAVADDRRHRSGSANGTIGGRTLSAIESKAGQHYFDLKALQAQLADDSYTSTSASSGSHRRRSTFQHGGGGGAAAQRDTSPTQTLQHRAQSRLGQRLADKFSDRGDDEGRRSATPSSRSARHASGSDGDEHEHEHDDAESNDVASGARTPRSARSPSIAAPRAIRADLTPAAVARRPSNAAANQHLSRNRNRNDKGEASDVHSRRAPRSRGNSLASMWLQDQEDQVAATRSPETPSSYHDDTVEGDEGYLSKLHMMTDDELQSYVGATTIKARRTTPTRPTSPPWSPSGSGAGKRPFLSPLQSPPLDGPSHTFSTPQLPSEARMMPSDKHDDVFIPVLSPFDHSASMEILRKLSRALAKSRETIATLRATIEEQAADFEARSAAQARTYETRQEAIKTVCRHHGIAEGTIDRAVSRALADMPQVRIDVEQQARDKRQNSLNAPSNSGMRQSRYVPETEHALGFSLQEAMLENFDGRSDAGGNAKPSRSATPKSQSRSRSTSKSQPRDLPSSAPKQLPVPPRTPRRPSAAFMPWSVRASSDRKASATTQATSSAAVEADGYLSDARSASTAASPGEDTSPAHARRYSTASSAADMRPASVRRPSASSVRNTGTVSNAATLKAAPTATSSNTSSAFGFFSSLAWRQAKKKKAPPPAAAQVVATTLQASRSPSVGPSPTPQQQPPPSASAFSTFSALTDGSAGPAAEVATPSPPAPARPAVQHYDRTVSGRDVISALHEAIGSAPVSPSEQRDRFIDVKLLPKPTHLKAIFLATRILGADASSVLLHNGKEASQLVSQLAFNLVATARDEGLNVKEPARVAQPSIRSTFADQQRQQQQRGGASQFALDPNAPISRAQRGGEASRQRPQSVAVQAASVVVSAAAAAAAAGSATATAGRRSTGTVANASANASATRTSASSSSKRSPHVEPNVTRLPLYFGFSQGYTSSATPSPSPAAAAAARRGPLSPAIGPDRTAPPVELEPIVPLDGKPASLAIFSRRRFQATSPSAASSPRRKGARRMRSIIDKSKQQSPRSDDYDSRDDDDESSGDEFEVYGGKSNFVLPTPVNSASTVTGSSRTDTTTSDGGASVSAAAGYDDRAVDVFGFVYDATPADVRLLRQARLESTPAPACLTGIRVGIAARGADSDDSDSSDGEGEGDDGEDEKGAMGEIRDGDHADDVDVDADTSTDTELDRHSHSDRSKTPSSQAHPMDLLGLDKARPSTEATALSASCVAGGESEGPTSPTQELDFRLGSNANLSVSVADTIREDAAGPPKPKSTSETVRSLLDQLKVMHSRHQAEQMEKWDAFIQHRRIVLAQHRQNHVSHSDRGDDAEMPNGADQYHYGLIGLQQMGEDKASRDDYRQFLKLCQEGIPLAHRPKVWAECSGANEVAEPGRYQDLLDEHAGETNQALSQIDLDIHRTMPTNIYFGGDGPGVPKLRRVLAAYSSYNPEIGYCQGMNNLAATLLLTHATEEEAFWVLVCIIEKILPSEYFTSHLLASQADQRVLIELVAELLPKLAEHLEELGVDLPAVTFAWFLSLYTDCLPVETLFHVWDVFFAEGSVVLFRIAVAILIMNEGALLATTSPAAFYGHVHSMTSRLFSVDRLISIASQDLRASITVEKVEAKRARHVSGIKLELGLE